MLKNQNQRRKENQESVMTNMLALLLLGTLQEENYLQLSATILSEFITLVLKVHDLYAGYVKTIFTCSYMYENLSQVFRFRFC